jgi:ankyrin repeat protein
VQFNKRNLHAFKIVFVFSLLAAYGCAGTGPVIIKAAGSGDIHTVKKLHAEGRNISEADSDGTTALMHAIWSKKLDVAKYLIESGANIKAKDGYDALLYAIDYKQFELIKLLMDKGADIESRDSSGRTPLAHAILNVTDVNVFKKIASKATNVNPRDEACEVVNLLIKKGANINAKDNASETVLDIALSIYNGLDIVALMVNSGANLFIPADGKARLMFIGEEFFHKDSAWVTIGDISKYLAKDIKLAYVDVNSGKHTIEIPVSWYQKKINADINVEAGQTYYFEIAQNTDNRASQMIGGIVLEKIVEQTSGKGMFFITPIEESVAKVKIHALLKPIN